MQPTGWISEVRKVLSHGGVTKTFQREPVKTGICFRAGDGRLYAIFEAGFSPKVAPGSRAGRNDARR